MSGLKTAVLRHVKAEQRGRPRPAPRPTWRRRSRRRSSTCRSRRRSRRRRTSARATGPAGRRGRGEHAPARPAARARRGRGPPRAIPPLAAVHRQRGDDRVRRAPPGCARGERTVARHRRRPEPTVARVTTVLVTGGAGFIGSNLADRLLAEEHRVVAVDDLIDRAHREPGARPAATARTFTFFNMDVRADGLAAAVRATPAGGGVPPRGAGGRSPVARDPVRDAVDQRDGHR